MSNIARLPRWVQKKQGLVYLGNAKPPQLHYKPVNLRMRHNAYSMTDNRKLVLSQVPHTPNGIRIAQPRGQKYQTALRQVVV